MRKEQEMKNAIHVIEPYLHAGQWVFDDSRVGLEKEPFVAGIDTMLDNVTENIPGAEKGFVMLFSDIPFPGHQISLQWRREEFGGNTYYSPELDLEGWLCPALLLYYATAPANLYIQAKAK